MSPGDTFIEFNSPHHLHGNEWLEKDFPCETLCALKYKYCKDYLVMSCEKRKLREYIFKTI
jgi:predicted transglutaminase-like protease